MSEVLLSDGIKINLDMSKVTFGEWRKFFSASGTHREDDAFIEKITGLKPSEQENLLRDDYRRIVVAIVKEGNQPLSDPNSHGESTNG